MAPTPVDVPAFAAAQLELLGAELQAEMAQTKAAVGGHTPAALQRAGVALTNLTVGGRRTGMGGRTVLTLELDAAVAGGGGRASGASKGTGTGPGVDADGSGRTPLPEHGLRTGDVVLVAEQAGGSAKKREMRELEQRGVRGVVTRVRRAALEVALDDRDDKSGGSSSSGDAESGLDALLDARVWLVKLADDVTYQRMAAVMKRLQAMPDAGYSRLMEVAFGQGAAAAAVAAGTSVEQGPLDGDIDWVNPALNASQKEAVRWALGARELALIHGPPGTGKTHTLVELVLQLALRRGQRVLVCGPSNVAVDNLVERLAPHGLPMVRLGHPARLLPSVLAHSLDVLTQTSAAGAIVADVRADMDAKQAELAKGGRRGGRGGGGSRSGSGGSGGGGGRASSSSTPRLSRSARQSAYAELRELRREFRERERRCVRDLVAGSRVVLATLHGAGGSQLRGLGGADHAVADFDVVVIDEAAQALEAQCWVPLITARKAVLAGDHLQLPPTVKAGQDKKSGGHGSLSYTLFDRMLDMYGDAVSRMLTTQYRMHERIMRFPSDALYGGRLVAAEAVQDHLLRDIRYGKGTSSASASAAVADTDDTREPLVFIDTQGGEFPEDTEEAAAAAAAAAGASARARLLGDSKSNAMEALLVRQHVRCLVAAGLRPADIAVISPYNGQLAQLAPLKAAFPGLELGSVDGFQGREKEAVIVSLVRSNAAGDVGFLAEKRRLNVAMTRPRRSLTIIGDSETVRRGSSFLKQWMDFLEEHADLRYPDLAAAMAEA